MSDILLWPVPSDANSNDVRLRSSSSGTAYSVSVDAATLTLSGQSVNFFIGLPVTAAGLTLTGQNVGFTISVPVTVAALSLTGQNVGFAQALPATPAALALTGENVSFALDLPVSPGALTFEGQDVTFTVTPPALIITRGGVGPSRPYRIERRIDEIQAAIDKAEQAIEAKAVEVLKIVTASRQIAIPAPVDFSKEISALDAIAEKIQAVSNAMVEQSRVTAARERIAEIQTQIAIQRARRKRAVLALLLED